LRSIARAKLLILDDWGPETLTPEQARDLLEIVEDRYDKGSIIITSQVPVVRLRLSLQLHGVIAGTCSLVWRFFMAVVPR